jgi:hypothetical protein
MRLGVGQTFRTCPRVMKTEEAPTVDWREYFDQQKEDY